jgi:hypothetical protein
MQSQAMLLGIIDKQHFKKRKEVGAHDNPMYVAKAFARNTTTSIIFQSEYLIILLSSHVCA